MNAPAAFLVAKRSSKKKRTSWSFLEQLISTFKLYLLNAKRLTNLANTKYVMRSCVCVRNARVFAHEEICVRCGRLSQHTYTIFIQTLYKYRWITAVGLVIKSTKHLITTLYSWLSSCFYEPFFAQPCRLLLQRNVGGSNETTNIPNRCCEKTACTGLAAGPDSHVGARPSACLVGSLSFLNDRDCRLISVCVVSRWLQQQFLASGGAADASCEVRCPLRLSSGSLR